jgi:signal transduction histidine kinase
MERQMGRETLKHILSQQVQVLERDFSGIMRSSNSWNDLQSRSLNVISITIRRLTNTIDSLSSREALSLDMRHELRNQLTILMGYAQLMLHRRAGEMPQDAAATLKKMMTLILNMNASLDEDKYEARNS